MAQSGKPTKLKEVLDSVLGDLGLGRQLKRWQVVRDFGRIVGEPVSLHAQAYRIVGEILYVQVDHPTWLAQLHLVQEELMKKLNAGAGENLIKGIRFSLRS